jgi:dsRNA-specific ribonuclease
VSKTSRLQSLPSRVPVYQRWLALQLPIKNVEIYKQALTDKSVLPVEEASKSNTRLAFLGYGYSTVIVRDLLLEKCPLATPKQLSQMVSSLHALPALHTIGLMMELDKFVVMKVKVCGGWYTNCSIVPSNGSHE